MKGVLFIFFALMFVTLSYGYDFEITPTSEYGDNRIFSGDTINFSIRLFNGPDLVTDNKGCNISIFGWDKISISDRKMTTPKCSEKSK